jgi:hypothetical protein
MENKRPIQRRDFLKSATAASMLPGAASLVASAAKHADGMPNPNPAGGSILGHEAVDCLATLLRGMENVRSIYVFKAPLTAKPKKRSIEGGSYYDFKAKRPIAVSADEKKIISTALKLRASSHTPFWDAVLLVCQEQKNVPQGLLQAAQYHVGVASIAKGQTVTRQQVLGGALKQLCQLLAATPEEGSGKQSDRASQQSADGPAPDRSKDVHLVRFVDLFDLHDVLCFDLPRVKDPSRHNQPLQPTGEEALFESTLPGSAVVTAQILHLAGLLGRGTDSQTIESTDRNLRTARQQVLLSEIGQSDARPASEVKAFRSRRPPASGPSACQPRSCPVGRGGFRGS